MKHNYFFSAVVAIFLISTGNVFAQKQIIRKFSGGVSKENLSVAAKDVVPVFSQVADPSVGIGSTKSSSGIGYYSADDFQLTENRDINSMSFIGFQSEDNLTQILKGAILYIYEGNENSPSGIPNKNGTPVFSLDLTENDSKLTMEKLESKVYSFLVDTSGFTALANKKYWVVFAPIVQFSEEMKYDEIWNWFVTSQFQFSNAVNVDADNFFQSGATDWYILYDAYGDVLGENVKGLAFNLYAEDQLDTREKALDINFEIVPNPTQSQFIIKGADYSYVEILNPEGRILMKSNDSRIDVSNLIPGIYFVKIVSKDGQKVTKKLVKK